MNVLLDTNIIVSHLRGKFPIPEEFTDYNLAICLITYGELIYGAHKSEKQQKNMRLIEDFIREFNIDILQFKKTTIHQYAQIKANLKNKGKKLDDFDLLIAATSITEKHNLATHNIKLFNRIKQLKLIKI